MTRFKKPQAVVENGETVFVLYDGKKTKSVHSFYEFNNDLGGFVILDDKGEEVAFMDCVGNFTNKPTNFAREFNNYINSTGGGIKYGYPFTIFYTTLINFPSKYLISNKIRKIVIKEENFKLKQAKENNEFFGLLEYLRYKKYVHKIIKEKFKKADTLKSHANLKYKTEDIYFDM